MSQNHYNLLAKRWAMALPFYLFTFLPLNAQMGSC